MKRSLTVSLDEELISDLKEAVWQQRLNLSALVEALLIEGGKRLDPPLPYSGKKDDNLEATPPKL